MILGHFTESSTSRPIRQKKTLSDTHHGNFHAIKFLENNYIINEYIHCKLQYINSPLFYSQSTVPPQNQHKSYQEI